MQSFTKPVAQRRAGAFNPICKKLQKRRPPAGDRQWLAKLSLHDAELIRCLHEEFPRGTEGHMGYAKLAAKFDVSKTIVARVCRYETYTVAD
jgi:hypothetical protein